MTAPVDVAQRYVARHNQGLATGDFSALSELFAPAGVVVFADLPVGPFVGRLAIGRAFAARPPDDDLVLLGDGRGDPATYGWAADPATAAGTLTFAVRDGLIQTLTITTTPD